jgi:chemotaxis protein CheZ
MNRTDLKAELTRIERHITRVWEELCALQPTRMRHDRIDRAGAELSVVASETEAAANLIIDAAEQLLQARFDSPEEYAAFNQAQAMAILEACSFQDITGQRVSKVSNLLQQIGESVAHLAAALGVIDAEPSEPPAGSPMQLDGPQLPSGHALSDGAAVSQDDLDKMFG